MRNKNLQAISAIEYSMVIVLVVATFWGIQIYLKRALSERWRQTADIFGHGRVHESSPKILWE